jgi:aspartate aminotransferase-like enzyme
MMPHRSAEFERAWAELADGLRQAFGTAAEVALLTASGTGAMEAAVANLVGPGERALIPVGGKFSRRWSEICEVYGVEVSRIDLAPGEAPSAAEIAGALKREPATTAVFLTQCESSTGCLTDLEAVVAAVRERETEAGHPILVCVDSITSLCVDPLSLDQWGIDAAVSASQKGLLAPPGLAFVAANARARAAAGRVGRPRFYFDLAKYLDSPRPPFTPAVALVYALLESLGRILDLGLDRVLAANAASARALRAVVEAAGLAPVARSHSAGVVAFWVGDLSAHEIALGLKRDHGIIVAQGQDELAGKVLRVSGIGKTAGEILLFAGAFADVLRKLGASFDRGGLPRDLETILEDTRIWE